MKPAKFEYVRPASLAEALAAIAGDDDAKLLAGGQSLLPMMNFRLARPARLVDIGHLPELDQIMDDGDSLVLGALVRHTRLERDSLIEARLPLLREAARHIGHRAIRNQGTLGGSLAHADPAAELPTVLVALGATFHAESMAGGHREIAAEEFFVSHYISVLRPDEILTEVRVPAMGPADTWGFVEIAACHGAFARAGAACVIHWGQDGKIRSTRAALMSAGPAPLLLSDSGARGVQPHPGLAAELAESWLPRQASGGQDDRNLARVCLRRALEGALSKVTVPWSDERGGLP